MGIKDRTDCRTAVSMSGIRGEDEETMRTRNLSGKETFLRPLIAAFSLVTVLICQLEPARCEDMDSGQSGPASPVQKVADAWADWPQSKNFKITLEYRNYSYFEEESRGDSTDSINEGRLRVEYDTYVADNMRVYIDALLQADDAGFTHGFVDDFEDDDLKRNYFNFTEAFLDIYLDTVDLRLGKQIVKWGKADAANPTDNVSPTDYANLLDEDDIGVVAASLTHYWNGWSLQVVGVPGFTPTRLPPRGTRFSLFPPDPYVTIKDPALPFDLRIPIEDPELPPNTIDNSQFGLRLQTTYRGWDFSVSYYDGVNDVPAATMRYTEIPLIPVPVPVAIVPVYNRFRAFGGDFATTFGRWGLHGEAAQLVFDGNEEDSRFQYVIGIDYTQSNIIRDHDLFVILEYVGEDVTKEGTGLDLGGPPLDRVLTSAVATRIMYEFTEYTRLEVDGAIDLYQGDDYYLQPQLIHEMTDNFEVAVGVDLLGGPRDTFLGQFKDNDRFFLKLKYTF